LAGLPLRYQVAAMQPATTNLNTINVQLPRPLAQRILTAIELLSQTTTAERPEFDALREAIKTAFEQAIAPETYDREPIERELI
jgi:hypothetical protein